MRVTFLLGSDLILIVGPTLDEPAPAATGAVSHVNSRLHDVDDISRLAVGRLELPVWHPLARGDPWCASSRTARAIVCSALARYKPRARGWQTGLIRSADSCRCSGLAQLKTLDFAGRSLG